MSIACGLHRAPAQPVSDWNERGEATYVFSTLAVLDGDVTRAGFSPSSIAVDCEGNVFAVGRRGTPRHAILKISADGALTTFAGDSENPGYADGRGEDARFSSPAAVATDRQRNVYVADTGNHVIRKITPDGAVTTIAGLPGDSGHVDGTGAAARLAHPRSIAVDPAGNIFVTNASGTIRQITPESRVSTLAALPVPPISIAVDPSGSVHALVYDSDSLDNAKIFKTRPGGRWQFLAEADVAREQLAVDRTGAVVVSGYSALMLVPPTGLRTPTFISGIKSTGGIAVDAAGNLYLTEWGGNTIRKGTRSPQLQPMPNFVITTLAGAANDPGNTEGPGSVARLTAPTGVVVDRNGNAYVTEPGTHTIRKIDPAGVVSTFAGVAGASGSIDGPGTTARFNRPTGIGVDDAGNVYVIDAGNRSLRKISPDASVSTLAESGGYLTNTDDAPRGLKFIDPGDISVEGAGNVFVVDEGPPNLYGLPGYRVQKISPEGRLSTFLTSLANLDPDRSLNATTPVRIATDHSGNVYVRDTILYHDGLFPPEFYGNLRRFTPAGATIESTRVTPMLQANPFLLARIPPLPGQPDAIAVDTAGRVYEVSATAHTLGVVGQSVAISGATEPGYEDGLAADARFNAPRGVAIDRNGSVYVADTGSHLIRKAINLEAPTSESRLAGIAVRTQITPEQPLLAELPVRDGSRAVLFRAIGPGLKPYMPTEATLAGGPQLELHRGAALVASNANWGGGADLTDAFARAGVFPLATDGMDAALIRNIEGLHTVRFAAHSSGIGLLEVYDLGDAPSSRLANFSTRLHIRDDGDAVIVGFIIKGSGQKTLLLRGIALPLASPNSTPSHVDPRIEVFNGAGQRIAGNDNWAPSLAGVTAWAGAAMLPEGSKDAAVLLSVQAGAFTILLSDVNGSAGEARIEIFEVQ